MKAIFEQSDEQVVGGVQNARDEQGNELPNEPLLQLSYLNGNRLESICFLPIDVRSRPLTAEEVASRCLNLPVPRQAGGN